MTDLILADVSEWQGGINWAAYGAQNPAVIVRALYGSNYVDKQWAANIAGARANCKVRGIYIYLTKSQAVTDQANAFVSLIQSVGGLQPGEFAIVDIEEGDPQTMLTEGDRWVQLVHAALGGTEWEYSYAAFIGQHNVAWIAAYQGTEPSSAHSLWQFSDRRAFAGIASPCDASVFHGTVDDLYALVSQTPEDDMSAADIAQINAKLDALATQVAAVKAADIATDIQAIAQAELGRFLEEAALNFFWGQILKGEKDIYGVKDEIAASPEAVAHQKALAAPKAP